MIRQMFLKAAATSSDAQTDVVVIGSGIGGLSGAALLARYGFDVTVCESYSLPGGALRVRQSPTAGDPFGFASSLRRETRLQDWSHRLQRWTHHARF